MLLGEVKKVVGLVVVVWTMFWDDRVMSLLEVSMLWVYIDYNRFGID
jgi:hypothetical protein